MAGQIPKPSVPVTDPETGLISRDWYLYYQQQDQRDAATKKTIAGQIITAWPSVLIQYPDNVTYPIGINCPLSLTFASVSVKTSAGTATVQIDGDARLGSYAATSTILTTVLTTNNTIAVGGGLTITLSGVSSDCANLTISFTGTYPAAT